MKTPLSSFHLQNFAILHLSATLVELFCQITQQRSEICCLLYPDSQIALSHDAHLYSCCCNLCSETQSRIRLERLVFGAVWNALTRCALRNAPWCVWHTRARTHTLRTAVIYGGEKLMLMFSRWKSTAGVQEQRRERDTLWKQLLSLCWILLIRRRAALNTYTAK